MHLLFKVECRHKQDCCWVEVNLATLTYWGYYQILNIGVSLNIDTYDCDLLMFNIHRSIKLDGIAV